MAKFLIGLITGILLCIFFVVILVAVAATFSGRPPSIPENSTLMLDLSGEIPERNPTNVPSVLLQKAAKPTLKEVHDIVKKAAVDRRVNAIFLKPDGLRTGWAKTQEIRAALDEFKKSKKPLVAFLQVAGMREYYLASAADHLYVAPEGMLDVKGLRAEVMFFKNTLNKIGVQADLEHIGKYKSFSEPFTQDRMSDAFREVTNSLLDTVLGEFLATVSKSRQLSPEQLRAVLDRGPFLPEKAVQARLADKMLYEDQALDELKKLANLKSVKKLKVEDYNKVSLESLGLAGGSKIALVYAIGEIWRGDDEPDAFGDENIASDSISKVLREVADDKSIKGVILRIDSPGGDSFASDQIWREVNLLASKKAMVISMSDVAASGGYYMAMAGTPILAYPGTYTGSIGVVYGKANLHGLYDKLGINKEILSRGKNALIDTDYRSFTPAERQKVLEDMQSVYRAFVQKVADSRKKSWQEIDALAQGRVWLGAQAKDNGLIDELGGYDRAVALIKDRAKLKPEDKVTLVAYPPPKKLLDLLMSRLGSMGGEDAVWSRIRRSLGVAVPWGSLLEGGMLKVSPYWITVQ